MDFLFDTLLYLSCELFEVVGISTFIGFEGIFKNLIVVFLHFFDDFVQLITFQGWVISD